MAAIQILFLYLCIVHDVWSQGQLCLDCDNVDKPEDCHHHRECPADEFCATDVVEEGPEHHLKWKFHCKKHQDCHDHVMMGRRMAHHHPDDHKPVCEQCCNGANAHLCNKHLYAAYAPVSSHTSTTRKTTTIASTTMPTTAKQTGSQQHTAYDPNCRNHEEDGLVCSHFNPTYFCIETDINSVGYILAHQKCALHCGFCTPVKPTTTTAPTPTTTPSAKTAATTLGLFTATSSCRDIETHGIDCIMLAKDRNICTSNEGVLEYFRKHNCRKTCKLC